MRRRKERKRLEDKRNLRRIKTEGRKSIEKTRKGKSEKHDCKESENSGKLNLHERKRTGNCS